MLFTGIMNKTKIYIYSGLAFFLFLGLLLSSFNKKNKDFSEKVKISLRDVGNQLLLINKDSTSLVLPVVELADFKYGLSFKSKLSFDPGKLVTLVKESLKKVALSESYSVEVLQCSDNEVAYSYQMSFLVEDVITPCAGRLLPENCYNIQVKFIKEETTIVSSLLFLIGLFLLIIVFVIDFIFFKNKKVVNVESEVKKHTDIGSFQFYPDQNKLVKQAVEICLSKKECELLAIFVANPNQIIKREELTKKVWEDKGVFVGRSLDTYISKLRKKLKEDKTIKLVNIHGVGYKLEVS
ncbi:winged helix family transcriptional regulator [Tenacibaculum sp. Bg11-29]|nr:winged helix family transcriptional regulator [Tenacibaculum sp. Bg11-29]